MAYPLPGGPPQGARDEALDVAVGRLRNLGAITEAALAHLELDPLLATLLARVREIVGTDTAAVLLLDHKAGELVVRAAIGIEEEVEQGVRIPLGRGFAGRIAAERQAIHIPDIDKADVANPILREKGIRSLLGVPLLVEGEVLGVLHVGSLEPREFSGDDAELLQMAADRMALAIDHAWLYEAERHARSLAERAAEDLRRLQTITDAALGRLTLDDELLVALLDRVTEAMNVDTAAILLLDADGEELVARATRGIEGEIELGVRIPVGSGFAGRIAAERRPVFLPDVDHADVLNPILHEKGVKSLLGVPLLVEGEVIGVLHVGSLEPRDFAAEEASLLERAADRVALTIDRRRQHNVAELLQRQLLPASLPDVPGTAMAARYLAGSDEAHVGGDWYDVLPLSGGRIGIVMGDVMSRGLGAASVMSQMRTGLRAYAIEGDSPRRVLDRLDRLVQATYDREMATVAYLVLDPARGDLTYSLAGHPPPLVISADGSTRYLDGVKSHPVGVVIGRRYDEAEDTLEPGDTLLLYTDGLVERRDEPLEVGLGRLAEAAAEHPGAPDELCDALVAQLEGAAFDDVAVLAVQLAAEPEAELRLRLPAEAESLGEMRRALRDWMARVRVDGADAQDMLVAVGEAATNAVEHAYGPGEAEFEVSAEIADREVVLYVRDQGRWRAPRGQHRGRGLGMIEVLMDDVEVDSGEAGTVVRMRRALREDEPA